MSEPLDIRHLRYFLAVAEAGSFSRAADRLGISQPSVSQQMRDLEAGLRVPLFQRRGKRILLTPRGLIFQEHARALLHQVENLLHELNGEPGELRGALRLGVIPVLNVPLIPQLLGAFVADHPAISVTVEEISSTEIETALEEGRMDVGLGFLTRHSPNLALRASLHGSIRADRGAEPPVGKPARGRFFKIAPATPASTARQFCDAQNVGRNLSKASGPPPM
jgi:Transcriptional regulator